eukprot:CAMPEP_0171059114 /NCGR_PEP_ID=MMETSP0766_2-20121228/2993_1 /TAXON_ID=439317 /ORGANISM="Gambierdiscus australes, Strain CAWD 149" /LENGTH=93 /DNA_ID=CAMNT_0011514525 /DNA_START=90 /DNA_END=368 /DNA_ORIENTATION=+
MPPQSERGRWRQPNVARSPNACRTSAGPSRVAGTLFCTSACWTRAVQAQAVQPPGSQTERRQQSTEDGGNQSGVALPACPRMLRHPSTTSRTP